MRQFLLPIMNKIEAFADANAMVKCYADSFNEPAPEDRDYPMMISKIGDGRAMSGNMSVDITIAFVSILNSEKTNHKEVLSDMLFLTETFFTKFFEMDWDSANFTLEDKEYTVSQIRIPTADNAIGWATTFTVKTPMGLLKDNIPTI